MATLGSQQSSYIEWSFVQKLNEELHHLHAAALF